MTGFLCHPLPILLCSGTLFREWICELSTLPKGSKNKGDAHVPFSASPHRSRPASLSRGPALSPASLPCSVPRECVLCGSTSTLPSASSVLRTKDSLPPPPCLARLLVEAASPCGPSSRGSACRTAPSLSRPHWLHS